MTAARQHLPDPMQGELRWVRLPRLQAPHTLPYRPYWSGHDWQLGTAAYWESVAGATPLYESHQLGATFIEEVGACLLGGYGMPFWMAQAAFDHLREAGVFDPEGPRTSTAIESLLMTPLNIDGRPRRYRFPRQRATRLADALVALEGKSLPTADRDLRDWLTTLPGLGPKTASWIVRNHRSSDQVAIIDIHLARAGIVAGVFDRNWQLPRDYDLFEAAFLEWANQARVPASHLDACIWGVLAHDDSAARDILGVTRLNEPPRPVWAV